MSEEIVEHKNEAAVQQRLAAMFYANKDEITIPKIYIDMTEDIKAAAVLDELMFWTLPKRGGRTSLRVFRNGGLWLAVRRSDWWERKRLTERQSDSAIAKLIELDLIEKDVFLFDGKPTVHIRIKMANFVKLYGEKLQEAAGEEEQELTKDIADLYEMMGFPNKMVISNSPNGEMLNSPNGEIINSLLQPPTTSPDSVILPAEEPKRGSKEWKEKMKKSLAGKSVDWDVLGGEVDNSEAIFEKEALLRFESDLQLPGNWSWYPARSSEDKAWKLLREFVVARYRENKNCFQAYQTWRTQPYARGAMSNLAIKRNPENFPASWSDFLAAIGKSEPQQMRLVETDDKGAPISY